FLAPNRGLGAMYAGGGSPLERRVLSFHGAETTVNFPPLALEELGIIGHIYQWTMGGTFPDTTMLVVAIKLGVIAADLGLVLVMYLSVRKLADDRVARWAAIAYWLNPAPILAG